jgi:hypothetical protein
MENIFGLLLLLCCWDGGLHTPLRCFILFDFASPLFVVVSTELNDVVDEVLELLPPRTIISIRRGGVNVVVNNGGYEPIRKLHATSPLVIIAATAILINDVVMVKTGKLSKKGGEMRCRVPPN